MAERKTTFDVSSMTKIEGEGNAKAFATIAVNKEFVVGGIKVMDSEKGLFVAMPSEIGRDGNYRDISFPITKEAREQIQNAVLKAYDGMIKLGLDNIKNEFKPPERSVSYIKADMRAVENNDHIKAAGQIVIDNCLVVTGVKMCNGTNAQGENKDFVSMPSRQNEFGEYFDTAHAITKACKEKIDRAVTGAINNINRFTYKGVKYEELGDKENIRNSGRMNNTFAEKVMNQLDKVGVKYQAQIAETTTISFKAQDKAAFDAAKNDVISQSQQNRNTNAPKQNHQQRHGIAV